MLISLEWIRDYVDLPRDLDARDLAERITRTTAEVEAVTPVRVEARGLIAARVQGVRPLPDTRSLSLAVLNVGRGGAVETVTAAPVLHEGWGVLYAPPGASVAALGEIGSATVAGRTSTGMILPGDAVGIEMAAQDAVFLEPSVEPGQALDSAIFDDWIIEIDNKSLTHRPDLWGHYGIAREIAAMCKLPLKPYPVVSVEELSPAGLPEVPISIADGHACRRYTGIVLEGAPTQPAPLWMQLRLGRTGLRPIHGLVDLTNYIMTDLGQPMHAFDAARVPRIEVDWARDGELFRTLDGMERRLTTDELMIQCEGRSIALGGVMGGIETEVAETTETLLLESANFDPATIRRTATRLGLRTDASARFEKSLDPRHTVLSIQRFIHLARAMYPKMKLASRLSDCFPAPNAAVAVRVKPTHVARTIGRRVSAEEATEILAPLGFEVAGHRAGWKVAVPPYRATGDVSIEADVIEELARFIGYGTIEPALPHVAMRRFEINALHELQQRTLEYFTAGHRFREIHGYLWYDSAWLEQLAVDPGACIELKNPPAEGLHRFRRHLLPNLLAAVVKNRFHFDAFSLIELGSVFERSPQEDAEFHHVGLICAQRGKRAEADLHARLKGAIEGWAWERFARRVHFHRSPAGADRPWEHPARTAAITLDDMPAGPDAGQSGSVVGCTSVIDMALRRAMDEHLSSWSVVWAELRLDGLELLDHRTEPLGVIPNHPQVEMDFSIAVPRPCPYAEVVENLTGFSHPLLRRLRYVGSYEGEAVGADRRSLTFRLVAGSDSRTLTESDTAALRTAFESHVRARGYEMRT